MNYLRWNDLIASHFFRPDMGGLKVYLYATEDLIDELGRPFNADFQSFLRAVKTGPPWVTRHNQGICQKALQAIEGWESHPLSFPPYIAYLALFVIAVGIEGGFDPRAYYPRLRQLLGEDRGSGQYPSFDRMADLWRDLEDWSNIREQGALGIFTFNTPDYWVHVGIPISQTLLTPYERKVLPSIFADAAIDPSSPPPDEQLALQILQYGRTQLRSQTLHLLKGDEEHNREFRNALLEIVYDEIQLWDGSLSSESLFHDGQVSAYGSLRLCCANPDRIAQQVKLTLRCKVNREFPDDGFLLQSIEGKRTFFCEEFAGGWSSTLIEEPSGSNANASEFDWLKGINFVDTTRQWTFKLSASPIRILVSGYGEGLPGLVEVKQLPTSTPFYLLAHEECFPYLKEWGTNCCTGFEKIPILKGLPKYWSLFHVQAVHSGGGVHSIYSLLSLPRKVRIELVGGVRVSRRNEFFKFAPPKLAIHGSLPSPIVRCKDIRLAQDESDGTYSLPENSPIDTLLSIEVWSESEILSRRSIYLRDDFSWTKVSQMRKFDWFGSLLKGQDSPTKYVCGAVIKGYQAPPCSFNISLSSFESEKINVYLVGRRPGQIIKWPSESLPENWYPVWAIPMTALGYALFCGTSIESSLPDKVKENESQKVKEWKDLLWLKRRKIFPPLQPSLRHLWEKYQLEARCV